MKHRFLLPASAVVVASALLVTAASSQADEETEATSSSDVVETRVHSVLMDDQKQFVVFLRDSLRERILPIWIGHCEALAIHRKLNGKPFPRPLTHDLIQSLLEATGVELSKILVDELRPIEGGSPGTYFAVLTLKKQDGSSVTVDSRPSDAMALAVRMGLTVHVYRRILERNSRSETVNGAQEESPSGKHRAFY